MCSLRITERLSTLTAVFSINLLSEMALCWEYCEALFKTAVRMHGGSIGNNPTHADLQREIA